MRRKPIIDTGHRTDVIRFCTAEDGGEGRDEGGGGLEGVAEGAAVDVEEGVGGG